MPSPPCTRRTNTSWRVLTHTRNSFSRLRWKPFHYIHQGAFYVPTGGVITSIEFDLGGSPFFTITGISQPWNNFSSFKANVEANLHIVGSPFDDYLRALPGNESINGRDGNDTIVSGPGNDTFTGGSGNDQFRFRPHFGNDIVTDFTVGDDEIRFAHTIFASLHAVKTHAHLVAGHVVIEVSATQTVTLNTVHHLHELNSTDVLIY